MSYQPPYRGWEGTHGTIFGRSASMEYMRIDIDTMVEYIRMNTLHLLLRKYVRDMGWDTMDLESVEDMEWECVGGLE